MKKYHVFTHQENGQATKSSLTTGAKTAEDAVEELWNLFKNISNTDVIAIVPLRNVMVGWMWMDETPCVSLDFPAHDNEFGDRWLMCKGDYMNDLEGYFLADEKSINLDQSLFDSVKPPADWSKYIDQSSKSFGVFFEDSKSYTFIIPIKENWEAM